MYASGEGAADASSSGWLVDAVTKSLGSSAQDLADLVVVRSVLEEAVDDVEEAYRVNEKIRLESDLELARLEAEVARLELSQLRDKQAELIRWRRDKAASARRLRDDVCLDALNLASAKAEREALKKTNHSLEVELRRLPALERELGRLQRDLDAARRRERMGAASQRGDTIDSGSGSSINQAGERDSRGVSSRAGTLGGGTNVVRQQQPVSAFIGSKPIKKQGLAILDDKLLLKMFSFLTARGVLSCAQTNRTLFARVDALFGMGSSVAVAQRRRVKAQEDSFPNNNTSRHGTTPPKQNSRAAGGGSSGNNGNTALTAATAAAIASKLNAAEIKGIIALDERARKLELECSALRAEKEDLKAALDSTESVKEFLNTKLKESEQKLEQAQIAHIEQERQRKSDHEVIAFLDARNKELEEECNSLKQRQITEESQLRRQRDEAIAAKQSLSTSYEKQIAHLNQNERENKYQRKILVKEVKTLRAQLATIQRVARSSTALSDTVKQHQQRALKK
uniref:Uncharacterized protein n=1 Tax=Aureoumbra lagunensis TaxID=44058 RepID=A0A7S3JUF7_9STRA